MTRTLLRNGLGHMRCVIQSQAEYFGRSGNRRQQTHARWLNMALPGRAHQGGLQRAQGIRAPSQHLCQVRWPGRIECLQIHDILTPTNAKPSAGGALERYEPHRYGSF